MKYSEKRTPSSFTSRKTLIRLWPLLLAFVVLLFPFEWLSQLWPFFGQVFDFVFATAHAHHIGHITLFFLVGLLTLFSLPGLKVRPLLYLSLLVLLALGQEALQSLFGHHLPTASDGLDLFFDLLGWTMAYLVVWGWQWLSQRRKENS